MLLSPPDNSLDRSIGFLGKLDVFEVAVLPFFWAIGLEGKSAAVRRGSGYF